MLPSSAIQVVENSGVRLVVLNPPYYSLGAVFVIVGLVTLGVLRVLGRSQPSRSNLHAWPSALLVVPFVVTGIGLLTSRTIVTFSRDTGGVTVESSLFGISSKTTNIPLSDIRFAAVESGRGSRRLILVCQSGRVISIGVFSSQGGHYAAANAINDFLAAEAR